MWLAPNNVGKNSGDPNYNKLIAFPAAAGQPGSAVTAGAVTLPGGNGTWTNFVAGGATSDSAFAAAGRIECLFGSTATRIPLFTNT